MNFFTILQLATNVFLLSSSILLLFISLILWRIHLSSVRRLVILSLFIFSCSLWFLIRNPIMELSTGGRPVLKIADTLCQYGITFFSLGYVSEFAGGFRKKILRGCQLWTVVFIVGTTYYQFATEMEYADFVWIGALSNAVFIILMELCIGWENIREKNKETQQLFFSSLPILLGGLLEIINYLTGSRIHTTMVFFAGFMLFMFLQMFWFIQKLQEQIQNNAKMEKELSDARISAMISQIQPHFLYNSLLGIKQLCDTQPKQASDALEHFAYYLRGNLYSLSDARLIPFSKELEHMRDYLYLEKMRFEERLQVQWEIKYTDFVLPSLTLQPIAENAVRHGITKKKGGGTLTIKSEYDGSNVLLTVIDDGVGFDTSVPPDDSRPHVGIENVKKRVEAQCMGSLEIHSRPGEGTTVRILLPAKKNVC